MGILITEGVDDPEKRTVTFSGGRLLAPEMSDEERERA